jgi:hypothetical protein
MALLERSLRKVSSSGAHEIARYNLISCLFLGWQRKA